MPSAAPSYAHVHVVIRIHNIVHDGDRICVFFRGVYEHLVGLMICSRILTCWFCVLPTPSACIPYIHPSDVAIVKPSSLSAWIRLLYSLSTTRVSLVFPHRQRYVGEYVEFTFCLCFGVLVYDCVY